MGQRAERRRRRRMETAICSICNQLARPFLDELSVISTCSHVFHHNCLSRCYYVSLPADQKRACPLCRKPMRSLKSIKRLQFDSSAIDAEPDENSSMKKMEDELSAYASKLETQEAHLTQLSNALNSRKAEVEKEQARKEKSRGAKERVEQLLQIKVEELSTVASECTLLQKRFLEVQEQLAAYNMTVDSVIVEKEMEEISAVLDHAMSHDDVVVVLIKSFIHCNRKFKKLKFRSDLMASKATRTLKKFLEARDKLEILEERLENLKAGDGKNYMTQGILRSLTHNSVTILAPSKRRCLANTPRC